MKNLYKLALSFISLLLVMNCFAGTITITSPNGGEVWAGCTAHNITWTASGTQNNYSIDYSTDGGTSWISVTSGLSVTNGTYSWTAPNISSTTCLVRVMDANNHAVFDISDNKFSITSPLLLTAPVGGESWQAATKKTITWVANGTSNTCDIYYSTDAGTTWKTIITGYAIASGSYDWTLPNDPSTQCLVKISDHVNTTCMVNISPGLFTISPPTPYIKISAPNTTTTLYVGNNYSVAWTSGYLKSTLIKIDYTIDNGKNWIPVITSVQNSGSYTWKVPNTISQKCLVKITDLGNAATKDSSDVNFSIAQPYITVNYPNGGESITACNNVGVTWTGYGASGTYNVKYSSDNGVSWINQVSSTSSSSASFYFPNNPTNKYLVKVSDYNNTAIKDSSDAVFTVIQNTDIIITTPNGGETWDVGSQQAAKWSAIAGVSYFNAYYSIDNGAHWTSIYTYQSARTYNWTIPNNPSAQTLFKVEDYSSTCRYDVSDAIFTIPPPKHIITVTAPNSATTLYSGNTYTITWTNSAYVKSDFVKIEYTYDEGANWTTIINGADNTGSYSWIVPATASAKCKVRVSEFNNAVVNDVSDVNFTISKPYLTLTYPVGAENWISCFPKTITWTKFGVTENVKLSVSYDGGKHYEVINSNTSSASISWTPTKKTLSNNCYIKVQSTTNAAVVDSNKVAFTNTPNTDIIVSSPNGGDNLIAGSVTTISWVAATTSTKFTVYYTTDGTNWTSINTYTNSKSINWTVPNLPSTNCKVKIVDYDNPCIEDLSDNNFNILKGNPKVTAPNGGENWYVGTSYNITWIKDYYYTNFVKLEYTYDEGTSWSTIAEAAENTGTYAWKVPNTMSKQCKVRVSEFNNAATNDMSDVDFTITKYYVSLTYPVGGENMISCYSKTISWSRFGVNDNVKVSVSYDGGSHWDVINAATAGSSLSWSPNKKTMFNNCYIKIQSITNSSIVDSNKIAFTVSPNTDIIISSPNGGESLRAGSTATITWSSAATTTRFLVYYTIDGTTWNTINSSYTSSKTLNWTIPNLPSSTCSIRVVDYDVPCIEDFSDANFAIIKGLPKLTAPNGGETWYVGTSYNITWGKDYFYTSFVKLEYSTDDGVNWISIINAADNTGTYSWKIPNTLSTSCKVRVSEFNNPATNDVSDVNFTITKYYIALTYPVGGENLVSCYPKTISWARYGVNDNVKLTVTYDGGSHWDVLNSSTSGTSINWSPNKKTVFNNCYIKIQSLTNASIVDSNKVAFTVSPNNDIIVTYPNGGENLIAGTTAAITWSSAATSTRFLVYYAIDGVTWNAINGSYTSSKTLNWTIPNLPSTICKVRVVDYDNTCIEDFSDASFNILKGIAKLTYPNGGELLYSGTSSNITWTKDYFYSSFVKLEYSTNSGASWTTISNNADNTGTFAWSIPTAPSKLCRIRVSEYNNAATYDISDADFTISLPYIKLNTPAGGETWKSCNNQTLSWTRYGCSDNLKVLVSYNGGINWEVINAASSSTSMTWTPNRKIIYNNCYIKITSVSNLAIKDSCKSSFTIIPNTDIIVTSPNGGENLQAGQLVSVTWTSAATSTRFYVLYSLDGTNWNQINTSYTSSKSLSWTVPNTPSNNCKIRVYDYDNSCIEDYSDDSFSILPGTAKLTAPNGGETYYYGTTYNITWTNAYFYNNYVSIYYSTDNGLTWLAVAYVADNTGTYSWKVPNTYSDNCLVKVSDYTNPAVSDISDKIFSLKPGLTLVTPNGDNGTEEWRVCTKTTIKWTSGGGSAVYKIEYSIDNGTSWTTIISSYSSSGTNNTYDWDMPNTASTQCLVRITDTSFPLKTDVSKSSFTIKPCLVITSPNGGETLNPGSTYNISWTSLGASNYYNIDYSIDGGKTYTNIVLKQYITDNTYAWKVPNSSSTNCLIKITDNLTTCKTDVSDNSFAIGQAYPTIKLTSLNGGETITGCATYNLTWTAVNTSNYYTLEYSKDKGVSWIMITSNLFNNTGSYAWNVANISSTNCLVRVKDYVNQSVYDISNAAFTINSSYTATIIPGGATTFCSGNSVILTSGNASGNTWSPGGQTTQSITVSSQGSYSVTVNNSGCIATSAPIVITVNPAPSAPVATSNSPVQMNSTLKLYASTVPNASYTWTGPNSYLANIINPIIPNATSALNGVYSVKASVNGCESASAQTTVTILGTAANVVISGSVMTETGNKVYGVKMKIVGTSTKDSTLTATDGAYSFTVKQGSNYTITPSKNNDVNVSNGITTLDLVLMQRHILNTQLLTSPYSIIAADVNESASISNLDILLIKSLILANTKIYPSNKLWSFVNSDFVFPNPAIPYAFESTRSYSSANNLYEQNFVGIKLGDVNSSYNPAVAKSNKASELSFIIDNQQIIKSANQLISIPVIVKGFDKISGFQCTMSWDKSVLEFAGTENAMIDPNFGINFTNEGSLTMLWSNEKLDGISLADGSIAFVLTFNVTGNAGDACNITLNSNITPALAYDNHLREMNLTPMQALITIEETTSFNLKFNIQNSTVKISPNPFNSQTEIMFYKAEQNAAKIVVFNMLGREVKHFDLINTTGLHKLIWNGSDDNGNALSSGTYYLRLSTNISSEVKKLILVR